MPDERDKPQPGAVPHFVSPHQVTAPLSLHQGPWVYPPPPPPPSEKTDGHGADLAFKLIGVALAIGTIIYSAGALSEKLRHIEENQKANDAQQVHRAQQHDDRYDRLKASLDAFGDKVEALSEQVREQARAQHHGRRRDAAREIDTHP